MKNKETTATQSLHVQAYMYITCIHICRCVKHAKTMFQNQYVNFFLRTDDQCCDTDDQCCGTDYQCNDTDNQYVNKNGKCAY